MEYLDPIDSFENVKINYREVTGKTSSLSQNLDVRIKKKKTCGYRRSSKRL